jgi:hypothetical protein
VRIGRTAEETYGEQTDDRTGPCHGRRAQNSRRRAGPASIAKTSVPMRPDDGAPGMGQGTQMRRFTLIFHHYIGYGSYVIDIKRIRCRPSALASYRLRDDLHFVISGWPPVSYPNGSPIEMKSL